jgi:hypothetical protein
MPPQESDALLSKQGSYQQQPHHLSLDPIDKDDSVGGKKSSSNCKTRQQDHSTVAGAVAVVVVVMVMVVIVVMTKHHHNIYQAGVSTRNMTGPYHLVESHWGQSFWDYYDFADGPDSLGSAGYNVYVGQIRAEQLGIVQTLTSHEDDDDDDDDVTIMMSSAPGTATATTNGPSDTKNDHTKSNQSFRQSIRLEGKRRFDRGLIVFDVEHMPFGCGVWPAFWTTDEDHWPDHGEIDILEGINTQDVVKTALHTSEHCNMYAHVPRWSWSGQWDIATGLPDTFTGQPNENNRVEADDCFNLAPHQWANQGCVAVSSRNGTIGQAMNDIGGGVYVMEWDPAHGYIRSWVFSKDQIPTNLQQSMKRAQKNNNKDDNTVVPDPSTWGVLPYAYFAIGDGTGCSADHFVNHHIVINLAFCGTVAGNRFQHDCPALYQQYNVNNDSVLTCNAYIDSNPSALDEAYWKIRGVYLYQRG